MRNEEQEIRNDDGEAAHQEAPVVSFPRRPFRAGAVAGKPWVTSAAPAETPGLTIS